MANVQLFWSVVESEVFALPLRELLWFITESPAIVDRDAGLFFFVGRRFWGFCAFSSYSS